jgi:hypothetical protein
MPSTSVAALQQRARGDRERVYSWEGGTGTPGNAAGDASAAGTSGVAQAKRGAVKLRTEPTRASGGATAKRRCVATRRAAKLDA